MKFDVFEVKNMHEFSFEAYGWTFLVIYGQHKNGWFCAVPNWNISCELGHPADHYYNTDKLDKALNDLPKAQTIAEAIRENYRKVKENSNEIN